MPTPTNPSKNQTTYFINPEDADETTRLLLQDRMITREMGGVFPPDLDLSEVHLVLDLACGPGGWATEVSRLYPQFDVVGVDISEKMIRYAQANARAQRLDNVSFQVMDLLKPFEFPDEAFEFVNARFISPFMPNAAWSHFLSECLRITRPGGIIRLTDIEWPHTSSLASEQIFDLLAQATWLAGRSFSPTGRKLGICVMLRQFMRDAGITNLHSQAYPLDYSYGTEAYETCYQDFALAAPMFFPFLQSKGVVSKEEYDRLYEQAMEDIQSPDFRALWFFLSAWGIKPERA